MNRFYSVFSNNWKCREDCFTTNSSPIIVRRRAINRVNRIPISCNSSNKRDKEHFMYEIN